LADVTTNPDAWLVIVSPGAVRSAVVPVVTVQRNERDTLTSPSLTKMVTLYVPALVGVPVICPVLELSATPGGRPVCVKVRREPSGSLTTRLIGRIAVRSDVLRFVSAPSDGIENRCSVEYEPRPLELRPLTATYTNWPDGGENTYEVWLALTVATRILHESELVPMHTS
jgi:hypothetical protein